MRHGSWARRLAAILVAASALALPAWAGAETTITRDDVGGGFRYTGTGSGSGLNLTLSMQGVNYRFTEVFAIDDASLTCTAAGVMAFDCPPQNVSLDTLRFIGTVNDDRVNYQLGFQIDASLRLSSTFEGGEGNDLLFAGGGNDVANGGPGDDVLVGDNANFTGSDVLNGGPGRDTLDGELGRDELFGGEGPDIAVFDRNTGVDVTIDDQANDGGPGENDNVHGDIEDLNGSTAADRLSGNNVANLLQGREGNDTLIGLGGIDTFEGGNDDDRIEMRDGLSERASCGTGTDTVIADTIDFTDPDCENVQRSAEAEPDGDRDGSDKPADCNDANPAIKPGATDVLENGIDEDCSGGDAQNLDRDRDGVNRPLDCNDGNASIRPGIVEVLGNAIDENCDNVRAPFPRLDLGVANSWRFSSRFTRATVLAVLAVPAGTTVEVRCRGRGCPRGLFKQRVRRTSRRLNVLRGLRNRRLRAGTVIELRITAPGRIGKVVRYTLKRRAVPSRSILCLPPGTTTPRRTC